MSVLSLLPRRAPATERQAPDRAGHPGSFSYLRHDEEAGDSGEWTASSKWASHKPSFEQLGEFSEWLYPTMIEVSRSKFRDFHPIRVQQRWLYSQLPETCAASTDIAPLLAQAQKEPSVTRALPSHKPIMAVGDIQILTHRPGFAKALATAAGKAGDVLRLNLLLPSVRFWTAVEPVGVEMWKAPDYDEAYWSEYQSPINYIKFVESRGRSGRLLLLLVQQAAATTIFRPYISRLPTETEGGLPGQKPSLLNPNLLVSISSESTGGNPHCDVSFNTGTDFQDPQIALIDEAGYWSVWNIKGVERGATASLRWCGQVDQGFLAQLSPRRPSFREKCRLMWIKASQGCASEDALDSKAARSSALLVCSSTSLQVVDVDLAEISPSLRMSTSLTPENILDVQACPLGPGLIFVLTTRALRLINAFPLGKYDMARTPLHTLVFIPHERAQKDTFALGVAPNSGEMFANGYCIVYVYSPRSTKVDFFWIRVIPGEPSSVQFHQQTRALSFDSWRLQSGTEGIRTMLLAKSNLVKAHTINSCSCKSYMQDQFHFFQMLVQGPRLEVGMAVAAVRATNSNAVTSFPKITGTRTVAERSSERRQKDVFQLIENKFSVPDYFALLDNTGLRGNQSLLLDITVAERSIRATTFDLTKLLPFFLSTWDDESWVKKSLYSTSPEWQPELPSTKILACLEASSESQGSPLPLQTLRELAWPFNAPHWAGQYFAKLDSDIAAIQVRSKYFALSRIGTSRLSAEGTHQQLCDWFFTRRLDEANAFRLMSLAEAAYDTFLSDKMIIDRRIFPSQSVSESDITGNGVSSADSDLNSGSWMNCFLTPTTTTLRPIQVKGAVSSANVFFTESEHDNALGRLKIMARSADKVVPMPRSPAVVAKWNLGEDPALYSWTRYTKIEALKEEVRAKRAKDQERKARRQERLRSMGISYQQEPHSMPILPSLDFSNSQLRHNSQPALVNDVILSQDVEVSDSLVSPARLRSLHKSDLRLIGPERKFSLSQPLPAAFEARKPKKRKTKKTRMGF